MSTLFRTHLSPSHGASRQERGFSLIELMIALAIGLLIMASVVTIYVASSRTSRAGEIESQMNEDGLIALNILQQQIRMGGYSNFDDLTTTDTYNFTGAGVIGCSAAAFYPNAGSAQALNAISASDCATASTYGDGIVVRYEADTKNTIPTSAGLASNCLMNTAYSTQNTKAATYYFAENRYFVAKPSSADSPALYCATGTGAVATGALEGAVPTSAQPLFDGVEKMLITYGVSATNDANDTQVVTYLSGSDLDSAFSADGLNDRWKRVVSVKICLLMRSPEKLADLPATASYRDCSGTVVASTDGYLHRAFITTATLRNRLTITDRNRKNES